MVWVDYSWSSFSHCLHFVPSPLLSLVHSVSQVDNPLRCSHTVRWGQRSAARMSVRSTRQASLALCDFAIEIIKGFVSALLNCCLFNLKKCHFVWVFKNQNIQLPCKLTVLCYLLLLILNFGNVFAQPYFCFCTGIFICKSRYRYTRCTTEAQHTSFILCFWSV